MVATVLMSVAECTNFEPLCRAPEANVGLCVNPTQIKKFINIISMASISCRRFNEELLNGGAEEHKRQSHASLGCWPQAQKKPDT